jgi:hypothetical protein
MQMRPKTYLHFTSLWRSLRDAIPPHHEDAPAEASPSLVYTTVVLLFLLAVLEVDAHRGELESLGLLGHDYPIPAARAPPPIPVPRSGKRYPQMPQLAVVRYTKYIMSNFVTQ